MSSIRSSLEKKTLLIVAILGIALATGSYIVLLLFINPAFHQLEYKQNQQDLSRVEQALQGQLKYLQTFNHEYAWWDSSYKYVQDPEAYPQYVEENAITPGYWEQVDIQMLLFFDPDGKFVWGNMIDPHNSRVLSVAENLKVFDKPWHELITHTSPTDSAQGFLHLPAGLMLVVASHILKSDMSGPAVGSVVVGRFISPELAAELGRVASTQVTIFPLSGPGLPGPEQKAIAALSTASSETVTEQTEGLTNVRKLLRDIMGTPVALLVVSTPRDVSLIGNQTVTTAMMFLLLTIVLFIAIGWLILRHWMVEPLLALKNHITNMQKTGDLTRHFTPTSNDEIGALATTFNHLAQDLNQTRLDLEESRDKALGLANIKGEFLASMSHEIRTPMNGVLGMAELLKDTQLDDRQREYVYNIQNSGDLLMTIINDILDFSRMESGKLQMESYPFNLFNLLEATVDLLSAEAHSKGLELLLSLPVGLEHEFVGDANRLRQVLVNLIGNAIKFTQHGEVLLKVTIDQVKRDQAEILIEVCDTGIGVSQANQEKIFDEFSQADGSLARKFGGTGLGLTISRQLIDLMGGEMGLDSEIDQGSNFWFRLRLPTTAALHPLLKIPQEFNGLRVLIVDDNETSRELLRQELANWTIKPDVVPGGPEALKTLEKAATEDKPYALVLIDWHMPGMDGPELARHINAAETIGRPGIILLGSAGNRDEQRAAEQLDIDRFLNKPVSRMKLHECLRELLSVLVEHETDQAPQELPVSEPVLIAAKVLLVEDNEVNQDVARFMLENCGCEVVVADNGASALEILEQERFDLILMDCQMPEMDGFEATRHIRENEQAGGTHVPIVALTANVLDGVREQCANAGMDDFLPKPFSKADLQATLKTWLSE